LSTITSTNAATAHNHSGVTWDRAWLGVR